MATKIPIDKAGRVVIPKPLRDALHLSPGDRLEVYSSADEITLRPIHETAPLRKENGFWVYRTGRSLQTISIAEAIRSDREERSRRLGG